MAYSCGSGITSTPTTNGPFLKPVRGIIPIPRTGSPAWSSTKVRVKGEGRVSASGTESTEGNIREHVTNTAAWVNVTVQLDAIVRIEGVSAAPVTASNAASVAAPEFAEVNGSLAFT